MIVDIVMNHDVMLLTYGIQPVIARNVSTTQQVMQRHQMCTFVRMAQGGGRGRQGWERRCRGGHGDLLFPVRSQLASLLVVATQPVHTGLDQDKPELGIAVLPVPLQVLAHGHSLLDEAVQVLRQLRGQTYNEAGEGR